MSKMLKQTFSGQDEGELKVPPKMKIRRCVCIKEFPKRNSLSDAGRMKSFQLNQHRFLRGGGEKHLLLSSGDTDVYNVDVILVALGSLWNEVRPSTFLRFFFPSLRVRFGGTA